MSPDAELITGDPLDIGVTTKDAGHGKLTVSATGPSNDPVKAYLSEKDNGKTSVHVETKEVGQYTVNIFWNEKHIPQSPFTLNVSKRLTADDMQVS